MLSQKYPETHLNQDFGHVEKKVYEEVDNHEELKQLVQGEKACDYLIRISNELKGELGVIALGPHTNLGLAHRI